MWIAADVLGGAMLCALSHSAMLLSTTITEKPLSQTPSIQGTENTQCET